MNEVQEQANESTMQKDCLCLQLHVSMPGVRAKADKSRIDLGGADEDMISVSKKIVDSEEYRKTRHCVHEMRAFLRRKSLPSPMLRGGFYMIPLTMVEDVQAHLDALAVSFHGCVDDFINAYENGLVEQARERLGDLFDEDDYPPASSLKKAFGVETMYLSLDVPGRLRTVSQAIYEKEQKAAKQRWRDLEEEAKLVLRTEMKTLVDKMVEQLGYSEDGKKKAFHKANVGKLQAFLDDAFERNVNDDKELNTLVNAAQRLLAGADVESIKKDEGYRDAMHHSFSKVKEHLDTMVVNKPTRTVSFEEV